jgi:hypothetical protein
MLSCIIIDAALIFEQSTPIEVIWALAGSGCTMHTASNNAGSAK